MRHSKGVYGLVLEIGRFPGGSTLFRALEQGFRSFHQAFLVLSWITGMRILFIGEFLRCHGVMDLWIFRASIRFFGLCCGDVGSLVIEIGRKLDIFIS